MRLTPEERQRRSDLAREMHRRGQLGAQSHRRSDPGTPARSASALARDLLEQNRPAVERELRRILASGSNREKLDAMKLLISSGMSAEKIDSADHRSQLEAKSRAELLDVLAHRLTTGTTGALLQQRAAELGGRTLDGSATRLS